MPQPQARDMLAIDRAILRLPAIYLELVRCHYFYRLAPRKSQIRLGIHLSAWGNELYRARQMVLNLLHADKRSGSVGAGAVQA